MKKKQQFHIGINWLDVGLAFAIGIIIGLIVAVLITKKLQVAQLILTSLFGFGTLGTFGYLVYDRFEARRRSDRVKRELYKIILNSNDEIKVAYDTLPVSQDSLSDLIAVDILTSVIRIMRG